MTKITANGRLIPTCHSNGITPTYALPQVTTESHLRLHYLQNRLGLTKSQAGLLAGLVWGTCHD